MIHSPVLINFIYEVRSYALITHTERFAIQSTACVGHNTSSRKWCLTFFIFWLVTGLRKIKHKKYAKHFIMIQSVTILPLIIPSYLLHHHRFHNIFLARWYARRRRIIFLKFYKPIILMPRYIIMHLSTELKNYDSTCELVDRLFAYFASLTCNTWARKFIWVLLLPHRESWWQREKIVAH